MSTPNAPIAAPPDYPGSHGAGAASDPYGPYTGAPGGGPVSLGEVFPGTERVDAAVVFAMGGYTAPKPIANPVATVALWLSVLAMPLLGFFCPVPLVLGIIGLTRSHSLPGQVGRHESAAALVLSGGALAWWVVMYAIVFEW
ncbi:hypothetical protein EHS14_08975 [Schaalia georgiae]|nr:hypothetical protein EHS14_08975 [Schaalia georgiae]